MKKDIKYYLDGLDAAKTKMDAAKLKGDHDAYQAASDEYTRFCEEGIDAAMGAMFGGHGDDFFGPDPMEHHSSRRKPVMA